jgi:hypothetical protein
MMNMTQWPFLMERMPRVKRRTRYRIPKPNHAPVATASGGISWLLSVAVHYPAGPN